jgi:hypothetical protein
MEMFAANAAPQRSLVASMNGAISLAGNACWSVGCVGHAPL